MYTIKYYSMFRKDERNVKIIIEVVALLCGHLGPGVHHCAVRYQEGQIRRYEELVSNVIQHKRSSIAILPEDDSSHPPSSSVGGVVLSPDKAVLHHLIP